MLRSRAAHGLAAATLALAALLALAWMGGREPLHRSGLLGEVGLEADEALDAPFCGIVEPNTAYVGLTKIAAVSGSPPGPSETASDCCTHCQANPHCRAWTWGSEQKECRLFSLEPNQFIMRQSNPDLVSGKPFAKGDESLFCFALIQPAGYEHGLVAMQHRERVGIFACDEYGVYSNESLQVAPGVTTSVIDVDLHCDMGGEFGTALNTNIFLSVWTKVVMDGRFRYHEWTVKADADSVFFPNRLRVAVHFHRPGHDDKKGVYLNNCKYGLHGPVEVLSRQAVISWASGSERCVKHFHKLCSGPCMWGEDMFLDQCMKNVLDVRRVDDWNILSEAHCDSEDWQDCKNGAIAFHPFKSPGDYRECLANANYGALPSHAGSSDGEELQYRKLPKKKE